MLWRTVSVIRDQLICSVCPLHSAEVKTHRGGSSSSSSRRRLRVTSSIFLFHKLTSVWWSKHYLTFCNILKVCLSSDPITRRSFQSYFISSAVKSFRLCVRTGNTGLIKGKKWIFLKIKKNFNDASLMIEGLTHVCCLRKLLNGSFDLSFMSSTVDGFCPKHDIKARQPARWREKATPLS